MENDAVEKTVKIIMILFTIKQNEKLITKTTKIKHNNLRDSIMEFFQRMKKVNKSC